MSVRILIVEDDSTLARTFLDRFRLQFKWLDPEVEISSSCEQAIARLNNTFFHVIVLDLNLTDSKGFATYTALRRTANGTPIKIITGIDDEEELNVVRAMLGGEDDLIIKPDIRGLLHVVREVVHENVRQSFP